MTPPALSSASKVYRSLHPKGCRFLRPKSLSSASPCSGPILGDTLQSMWVVRAGKGGESVEDFLSRGVVAFEGKELGPLSSAITKEELLRLFGERYTSEKPGSRASWASQLFRFISAMKVGDLVVLPDPERRSAERELHLSMDDDCIAPSCADGWSSTQAAHSLRYTTSAPLASRAS